MDKFKECIKNNDIDGILMLLMDINNIDCDYNELDDLLTNFYEKEKEISNVVFNLSTLKDEKWKKKKSCESGYFQYKY